MERFRQYDVVRIIALPARPVPDTSPISQREPRVGDIATIVEIYEKPSPGYELECTTPGGTEWLHTFRHEDVELELESRPDPEMP